MRALAPAADDARALAEGRPPRHRAVHSREGRWRRLLPEARTARALPNTSRPRGSSSRRGATPTRSAPRRSPSSAGRRRWGRSRSTRGRFGATTSTIPDELRIDLDPQPGTDYPDAVRVAGEARALLDELGYVGFPKTSGGRGMHIYVRIEPRWTFTDVRHAAIAFGRELERRLPGEVTTKWWKEERGERIFVDYNQNARDRTIASAYSIRPKPGAPVSAPLTWDELTDACPRTSPSRRCRRASPRSATATPRSTTSPTRCSPCSTCTSATRPRGAATCPTRPTTRRCRASRSACSRRAIATARKTDLGACGSFFAPRLTTGRDGGGTTGPMSPSGASSRSTITGAWSLGPLPLRACRSTHAALTRSATGSLASTRSIRIPRSWWNIPAR